MSGVLQTPTCRRATRQGPVDLRPEPLARVVEAEISFRHKLIPRRVLDKTHTKYSTGRVDKLTGEGVATRCHPSLS